MPSEAIQTKRASQTDGGPFTVRYAESADRAVLADDPHTLALIGFGDTTSQASGETCDFNLALPQLAGAPMLEHWRSPRPVERLALEGLHIARNDEVMFASLQLAGDDIAGDTRRIYARILELLRTEGYPHLLRVWNYFPRINAVEDGMERYQSFCVGRYQALEVLGDFETTLPAASALGSHSGALQVYFVAAREAGIQIENPRQVSAFRYPKRYSPRSPSFSRALLKRWPHGGAHLYISGTASIVGHETRHDDLLAQLEETLTNVGALIEQAHVRHGHNIGRIEELDQLKIYVREPAMLEPVRDALESRFQSCAAPQRVYLQATVCRSDLLVEIEGMHLGE
jgi:chorismate lyase / 3-hydroxybenzoate synthase